MQSYKKTYGSHEYLVRLVNNETEFFGTDLETELVAFMSASDLSHNVLINQCFL